MTNINTFAAQYTFGICYSDRWLYEDEGSTKVGCKKWDNITKKYVPLIIPLGIGYW